MQLVWLIVALSPAFVLAPPTDYKSEPPSNPTASLLTSIPPMMPVTKCTPKPAPTIDTQIRIRALAKLPGLFLFPLPVSGIRNAHHPGPACTTTHYRMYTSEQQAQVIEACVQHKANASEAPAFANCSTLEQANSTLDNLLPEMVGMRKQYVHLLNLFKAERIADDQQVAWCFKVLTTWELDAMEGSECTAEYESAQNPAIKPKANQTRREFYRRTAFRKLLEKHCASIGDTPDQLKPEGSYFKWTHTENLYNCEDLHKAQAWQCFYGAYNTSDSEKASFCKSVASGPDDQEKQKHFVQLHNFYLNFAESFKAHKATAQECFSKMQYDLTPEKCRHISWDRRDPPLHPFEAKLNAYYDCLVERDTAFYARNITRLTIQCD